MPHAAGLAQRHLCPDSDEPQISSMPAVQSAPVPFRRLGDVDGWHGRGRPRHETILVSAMDRERNCKGHKENDEPTHGKKLTLVAVSDL